MMDLLGERARRSRLAGTLLALLCLSLALTACPGNKSSAKGGSVTLTGAGASFPYPIYDRWIHEYRKEHPEVRINYQSIGSGGGIRQISKGVVDFGATDAPMKDAEAKKAQGKLHHIPTVLGAVAIAYNVPGVKGDLKLTGELLAKIFLGEIKKWNDAELAELNPDAGLPDKAISVIYRTDGSGTTAVFTSYLAKIHSAWKEKVGVGKSVKWPTGLGAKGNEGVSGQVKTVAGAIGYLELAYATKNKLSVVSLKNKAGQFVRPETKAITAAADGIELPDSLHLSLVDAPGKTAYPISTFTYILVYDSAKDEKKGRALARFLWWATHDGQQHAASLDYAPLPKPVVTKIEARLKQLKSGGKPLLNDL